MQERNTVYWLSACREKKNEVYQKRSTLCSVAHCLNEEQLNRQKKRGAPKTATKKPLGSLCCLGNANRRHSAEVTVKDTFKKTVRQYERTTKKTSKQKQVIAKNTAKQASFNCEEKGLRKAALFFCLPQKGRKYTAGRKTLPRTVQKYRDVSADSRSQNCHFVSGLYCGQVKIDIFCVEEVRQVSHLCRSTRKLRPTRTT